MDRTTANSSLPMMEEYTWRPARREDVPAIYQLLLDLKAAGEDSGVDSIESLYHHFGSRLTRPATDSLLGWAKNGQIAALAWIFTVPGNVGDLRLFLWGEVHPTYRKHGLGDFVLDWMQERSQRTLRTHPGILQGRCLETQRDRVELYEKHNFQPERHTYHMRRGLHQPIPPAPLPEEVYLETWNPEMDVEILAAFNDAYSSTPSFEPYEEDLWKHALATSKDFRSDLSFIALAQEASTEQVQVVGFCMACTYVEDIQVPGQKEGWIHDLVVRRSWREHGIATALLTTSMHAFIEDDLDYAGLNVDADNPTRAMKLYQGLGFTPFQHWITFQKRV